MAPPQPAARTELSLISTKESTWSLVVWGLMEFSGVKKTLNRAGKLGTKFPHLVPKESTCLPVAPAHTRDSFPTLPCGFKWPPVQSPLLAHGRTRACVSCSLSGPGKPRVEQNPSLMFNKKLPWPPMPQGSQQRPGAGEGGAEQSEPHLAPRKGVVEPELGGGNLDGVGERLGVEHVTSMPQVLGSIPSTAKDNSGNKQSFLPSRGHKDNRPPPVHCPKS